MLLHRRHELLHGQTARARLLYVAAAPLHGDDSSTRRWHLHVTVAPRQRRRLLSVEKEHNEASRFMA
jgi:hypothetical protein